MRGNFTLEQVGSGFGTEIAQIFELLAGKPPVSYFNATWWHNFFRVNITTRKIISITSNAS